MAKQSFKFFTPRDKPKKRKGVHKKSKNKSEKRMIKKQRYKGQGRGWQQSLDILVLGYERKKINYNKWRHHTKTMV